MAQLTVVCSTATDGGTITLVGVDGIAVISGSNFTTISGFRTEFVSASGHLQTKITNVSTKTLVIEVPTNSEDIAFFYTDVQLEVKKLAPTLKGTSGSSITWTIRHAADRAVDPGLEVITAGTLTNLSNSGDLITSFSDPTISAGHYIWMETTAKTAIPTELAVAILFDS